MNKTQDFLLYYVVNILFQNFLNLYQIPMSKHIQYGKL